MADIVRGDTISAPKVVVATSERLIQSFPLEARLGEIFSHISPVERTLVRCEVIVVVLVGASNNGVEVVDSFLVASWHRLAVVLGALGKVEDLFDASLLGKLHWGRVQSASL